MVSIAQGENGRKNAKNISGITTSSTYKAIMLIRKTQINITEKIITKPPQQNMIEKKKNLVKATIMLQGALLRVIKLKIKITYEKYTSIT